jgi:hypothetical protein
MAMIRAGRRETRHGLRMLNQKPCSTHSQILLLGKKRALRKSARLFQNDTQFLSRLLSTDPSLFDKLPYLRFGGFEFLIQTMAAKQIRQVL